MSRIGINGFGRIGRLVLRHCVADCATVVAINDPQLTVDYMAYLFKHDTNHGLFEGTVAIDEDGNLLVNQMKIVIFNVALPEECDWASVEAEHVIECLHQFNTVALASGHLKAGAKKVIIAGYSPDAPTLVIGVNSDDYEKSMDVVSMATATTNCLALLASVVHTYFKIIDGIITVVHAVCSDQNTVDGVSQTNVRRYGRSTFQNIIPTGTQAVKAIGKVIPELEGKLNGMSFHVPTSNVSLVDFTVHLAEETNYERIRSKIMEAAVGHLKGIIGYTSEDVVSCDFMSNTCSCVFDGKGGLGVGKTMFKLVAWYDNEYAYAKRLVELVRLMQKAEIPKE